MYLCSIHCILENMKCKISLYDLYVRFFKHGCGDLTGIVRQCSLQKKGEGALKTEFLLVFFSLNARSLSTNALSINISISMEIQHF